MPPSMPQQAGRILQFWGSSRQAALLAAALLSPWHTLNFGFGGDRVLCTGVTCPGEASPGRNSSEVGSRMAQQLKVCVGTGDN